MNSSPDRYALIGQPVSHSRSPLIHQLFARQTGENLTYELIEADPDQFETAVRGFSAAGGRGMNVTVPHKEAAVKICSVLGREAKYARAVNTLTFSNDTIRGDNTDGTGFLRDLKTNQQREVTFSRVLILGAGGAARGILQPLLAEGPESIVIANRTIERAQLLRRDFDSPENLSVCEFDDLADTNGFDIVINATSAGLKGEDPPFPVSFLDENTFCYDLTYGLKQTPFVSWAKQHGAGQAVQGWGMLVEQAADSFEIWRGHRPETQAILQSLLRLTS